MSAYEDDGSFQSFDEDETYHPVFCVTNVPDEYFDEFNEHASETETPWVEVTTSNPSNILDELRKPEREESSEEPSFDSWSVDRVYEFYNDHVRPRPTSSGRGEHFTAFTFVVVDEQCVQKGQMIVCCDAPDFGEGEHEIKLKTMRLSIKQGVSEMGQLEQLCVTPGECLRGSATPLKVHPMPTMQALEKKPGDSTPGQLLRIATPAEARRNKRQGIMKAERGE